MRILIVLLYFIIYQSSLAQTSPNVILIIADDMALGDISALNGGLSKTPNIDGLIEQGIWFENAYSASPVCAPARASLLTGLYPHSTGVVTLSMLKYPELTRIKKELPTMADIFKSNGYKTGLIGKWHSGLGNGYLPNDRGFDEFEGFLNYQYVPDYHNFDLNINGQDIHFSNEYLTEELSKRAIDFVNRHHDKPFFLHLAHYAPHRPLGAPEDRIKPYLDKGLAKETATVYAMIEIMDEGIGALLTELDRLGIRENTMIIFASDNGPDPMVAKRPNLGLNGTKYTVNEGGIKVPFVLQWNKLGSGSKSYPITFIDVLPSLMELCALEYELETPLDGTSFFKTLTRDKAIPQRPLYWQWNRYIPEYSHNAAVRLGAWKYVRPYVTKDIPKNVSDRPAQLYNLVSDPYEEKDLLEDHPKKAQELHQYLQQWTTLIESRRTKK